MADLDPITGGGGNGDVHDSDPVTALLPDRLTPAVPEAPVGEPARKPRRPRSRVTRRGLWTASVRVYAGTLTLGIAAICLMALVNLFKGVFTPATLPATFGQWQGRLDPAALRRPDVSGVTTEAGRAPIMHYHKVDRWFEPDPRNTCTVAACHSPLPHPPKSRIAAFTNLHVTFLDCAVCHEAINGEPLAVHWVNNATGRPQKVPPGLRLTRVLEDMGTGEADAARVQPAIVALLKEMGGVAGRQTEVEDLLIQIESSVPHSPFWRHSVQELRRVLQLHARGEYGARMALDFTSTEPAVTSRLTREYATAEVGSARQNEFGKQIHAKLEAKPAACPVCHVAEGGKLNFMAAGYSPERARALRTLPLGRMIEQIRAGESFQLPRVTKEVDDGR